MNVKHYLLIILAFTSIYQIQGAMLKQDSTEQLLEQWFQAAETGNLEQIQALIGKIDINIQNKDGYTALAMATFWGRENIVKHILQIPGINVNTQDKWGKTALIHAATTYENLVTLLLQFRVVAGDAKTAININAQTTSGRTALMMAALRGHENIVKILLSVPGIYINAQDEHGITAFMFASLQGEENVVKHLLDVPEVYINLRDKSNDTALTHAEKRDNHVVAKLIQDKLDELISQAFEAINDKKIQTLKSLIGRIGINITDKTGDSLLHKAIKHKNLEIIRLILLTDLSCLDMIDRDSKDAIELSVGYPEIFEFLMSLTDVQRHCANPTCIKTIFCNERCSRCQEVYYCGADCQKKHWQIHRHDCKPKVS